MSNEFVHVTIWNMNGGPVPSEALDAVAEAVETTIKALEERHGVRLLHSVIANDPAEVV